MPGFADCATCPVRDSATVECIAVVSGHRMFCAVKRQMVEQARAGDARRRRAGKPRIALGVPQASAERGH